MVPLEYEPGVVRLFGAADIGVTGLKSGWSYPENGHTWNEGIDATLVLSLEDVEGVSHLVVEGQPYLSAQQPVQEITVFVNGFWAGFRRLTGLGAFSLDVEIQPEWWFRRGDRFLLNVVFHIPTSVRPVDLGEGTDSRTLGFCFRSLLLTYED